MDGEGDCVTVGRVTTKLADWPQQNPELPVQKSATAKILRTNPKLLGLMKEEKKLFFFFLMM